LILDKGVDDALERATIYVKAGADAVMPHHKDRDPAPLFEFASRFRGQGHDTPLIAVPTAYPQVTEEELREHGFQIVIYANHLLRSAYPAMVGTAQSILANGRALEAEDSCMPIREILALIPGGS
jgi:phosphoenolpyruvate phosphomutase